MEEKERTGFPSIDRPWLKYYSEEAINASLPECTIYEYFWKNNEDHLDDTAIDFMGNRISYGELFSKIKQAAAGFSKIGINSGDVVVLMMLNTPEAIISLYALNFLGAISDFIYFKKDANEIVDDIIRSNAKFFVSQELPDLDFSMICRKTGVTKSVLVPLSTSMPLAVRIVVKLRSWHTVPQTSSVISWSRMLELAKEENIQFSGNPNQVAVIVHTGGTTGVPKGVMLSNKNLNACVFQTKLADMGWERQKKIVHTIPPFVAYGIAIGTHMALCHGMHSIMIPNPDPSQMGKLLHKHRPYAIVGGPPHVESILSYPKIEKTDFENLRILIVGGESLTSERENQANDFLKKMNTEARIQTGYGMTETCSAVCVNMNKGRYRTGSLGIPFSHTIIAVFDPDTGKEQPYGVDGEICVSSPNNMLGYFNNAAATEEIIRKHDNSTWIHTGDIGRIDTDGFVYINGRMKRIYMTRNLSDGSVCKLFPSIIEDTITAIPEVVNCCVVCRFDDKRYNVPVAFAELMSKDVATPELQKRISEYCAQTLPEYALPESVHFIDKIPLTTVGKKDYRVLEENVNKGLM